MAIDLRATQVFIGFEDSWEAVSAHLGRRYPGGQTVVRSDGSICTLDELEPCGEFSVPATGSFHPGGLYGLVWVVDRLVGPGGCPWDIEQTHETLKKYLVEEAYELMQAIDSGDLGAMKEELGDVLLQPLMHSQKKQLEGSWGIDEVADELTAKLVRRHPHVFGDTEANTAEEVLKNWDAIKKSEKGAEDRGILDGVPVAMPALSRAMEVSKRAARAGFEWPDVGAVWEKFEEELGEVRQALEGDDPRSVRDEFGDLLFTVVNLARWSKVDAEDALRTMVDRFSARFSAMERMAGVPLSALDAAEWDELWERAKEEF